VRALYELRVRRVRLEREVVCALLLTILLAGWLCAALMTGRSARPATAGSSWGQTISKVYFDAAARLDQVVKQREAGAAPGAIRRIVVLPLAGWPARHYDFANLGARGMLDHLRSRAASGQLPALQGREIVAGHRPLKPSDIGIELTIGDLALSSDAAPEQFSVTLAAKVVSAGGQTEDLLPAQTYRGSNGTLSWFIRSRMPWASRLALSVLSLCMVGAGLYFAVIYYRLVGGTLRCPAWLARPVNDVRASTGLIASSLLLLSGFVLTVLVFLLAPRTGDALDERRTHVDVVVDGDEIALPAAQRGIATNPLSAFVERVVSEIVGGLTAARRPAGESAGDLLQADQPFPEWVRYSLPTVLRSPATEIRVSHGSSWRVFAAAEGEAYTAHPDPLWPGLARDRAAAIQGTFEDLRARMPERGLGIPLPWDTKYIRNLDPMSMASLRATGESGQGRLARLVVSSFQSPSPRYLQYWLSAATNRPAEERVYAVLIPGLPRSSGRPWESLEGRMLAARAVAQRVVAVQQVPATLSFDDPRLKAFGTVNATGAVPDLVAPVTAWDGVALRNLMNYGTARDLNEEAARVLDAANFDWSRLRSVVEDFRQWLWGGEIDLERIKVFTIPRAALLWLIGGLGLTFAVAGVRCEVSAQGMRWWTPPLMALLTAVVLPLIASSWLHSRGDTTRYVVFGYADLAFWGALFLWYCAAVLPLFGGRARVGYRRDAWMTVCTAISIALAAGVPLWNAAVRLALAQGSLALVLAIATGTLVATLFMAGRFASLRLTMGLVLAVAIGYWNVWGWEGQDVPAIFLLVLVLTMTVSGWSRGLGWWRLTAKADYDRIPWLKASNRILLALVLTMTGAATLYCSFPAEASGGLIRGFVSYNIVFCVLPFLLCAGVVIAVDLLEREAL
jgi:hypothetical protein